jgi:hypothetical protein
MGIIIGIVGFVFFLLVLEQYFKDQEERDRKKAEDDAKRKLEAQRLHSLKLEKDRLALEVYKSKLLNKSNLKNMGLNKDQLILWYLLIIIVALVVFITVWNI